MLTYTDSNLHRVNKRNLTSWHAHKEIPNHTDLTAEVFSPCVTVCCGEFKLLFKDA